MTYKPTRYVNTWIIPPPPNEVGPIGLFRDYVNKHDGFDDVKVIIIERVGDSVINRL